MMKEEALPPFFFFLIYLDQLLQLSCCKFMGEISFWWKLEKKVSVREREREREGEVALV